MRTQLQEIPSFTTITTNVSLTPKDIVITTIKEEEPKKEEPKPKKQTATREPAHYVYKREGSATATYILNLKRDVIHANSFYDTLYAISIKSKIALPPIVAFAYSVALSHRFDFIYNSNFFFLPPKKNNDVSRLKVIQFSDSSRYSYLPFAKYSRMTDCIHDFYSLVGDHNLFSSFRVKDTPAPDYVFKYAFPNVFTSCYALSHYLKNKTPFTVSYVTLAYISLILGVYVYEEFAEDILRDYAEFLNNPTGCVCDVPPEKLYDLGRRETGFTKEMLMNLDSRALRLLPDSYMYPLPKSVASFQKII